MKFCSVVTRKPEKKSNPDGAYKNDTSRIVIIEMAWQGTWYILGYVQVTFL